MPVYWPPELREFLQELLADTPPYYKKYVTAWAAKAAEEQSHKLGKTEIDQDCVIRGYITAVPRHLRDGIHEVLSQHNVDIAYYRPVFDEPNANLRTTVPYDEIDHHDGHQPTGTPTA